MDLKEARLRKNKSLEQVAHDLGLSYNAVWRYEQRMTSPRFDNACKLADYFGVTLEELRSFFSS